MNDPHPLTITATRKIPWGVFEQFGINGIPAKIIFNNKQIGTILLRMNSESFLTHALAVFIACFVIGLSLSVAIYKIPMSVVTRLEQKLADYHFSLEEQVDQRTAELQESIETALQLAEARRQDQEALLEAKETLEQRVDERTQALQDQVVAKEQALAKLAEAQGSLVAMSRAAGMAEVATGVLHNVGNVLNSVNVSCDLIMDQVRESRVANIAKLADLMAAHSPENLGQFLSNDPRGRQIPAYLISLSPVLIEEQQLILKETEALHQRIAHIKEIVTMQQTYGRVSGVLETIAPEQLMEDALKLNADALAPA